MQAVSSVTHVEFSKVKIGFDCTMVLISAVTCLSLLHTLGSVGAGTIIAAVLVGTLVGILNRAFGKQRDKLLGKEDETAVSEETSSNYVITISREFGSGGREIGKLLAERFGFAKESALIHELSQKGSCIIVGRLANYILEDMPTAYHVFISADLDAEATRVSARDNISPQSAAAKVKKVNHERAIHCRHFIKTDWGNVKNYDLCIKSDDFGVAETAQIIGDLFQKKMGL